MITLTLHRDYCEVNQDTYDNIYIVSTITSIAFNPRIYYDNYVDSTKEVEKGNGFTRYEIRGVREKYLHIFLQEKDKRKRDNIMLQFGEWAILTNKNNDPVEFTKINGVSYYGIDLYQDYGIYLINTVISKNNFEVLKTRNGKIKDYETMADIITPVYYRIIKEDIGDFILGRITKVIDNIMNDIKNYNIVFNRSVFALTIRRLLTMPLFYLNNTEREEYRGYIESAYMKMLLKNFNNNEILDGVFKPVLETIDRWDTLYVQLE